MNICNTCALSLGASQELCGCIGHDPSLSNGCDNCGHIRMLKGLGEYELLVPDYVTKALDEKRKTRRAKLVLYPLDGFSDLEGFMIEDLGPQPVSTTLLRHLAMCGML